MTVFMKLGDINAFGCREVVVAWCYASTVRITTFLNLESYTNNLPPLATTTIFVSCQDANAITVGIREIIRMYSSVLLHVEIVYRIIETKIFHHSAKQFHILRQFAVFNIVAEHVAQYPAKVFMSWV